MKIIKFGRKPIGKQRQYSWRAVDANGRTVATGEKYSIKLDRDLAVFRLRVQIQTAEIIDND